MLPWCPVQCLFCIWTNKLIDRLISSTGSDRLSTDTIDDVPAPIDGSDLSLLCKTSHRDRATDPATVLSDIGFTVSDPLLTVTVSNGPALP